MITLCHQAYYSQLLKIFLAEIGSVGARQFEEFAHYLHYSVKVIGAKPSFHYFVQSFEIELKGRAEFVGGINIFDLRGENIFAACFFEQGNVGIERTGVASQVIGVIELRRIDKHTDNSNVILCHGSLYQRQVSSVQSTHCRHQTYCFIL